MLHRKSEEKEGSIFESSVPLEPLDVEERNRFLGETEAYTPPQPTKSTATPSAVIGPKIRFKGELFGEEDLLVQGQVDGTILLKDHNLIVGDQGVVKANVTAKTIVVQGKVEGDLSAGERVSITKSSNVQGNVKAARVVLEDGAKFRGSIDMDVKASDTGSKPNKPTPPSSTAPDKPKEPH